MYSFCEIYQTEIARPFQPHIGTLQRLELLQKRIVFLHQESPKKSRRNGCDKDMVSNTNTVRSPIMPLKMLQIRLLTSMTEERCSLCRLILQNVRIHE